MATNKVTIVLNAEDNASQKIRDVMRGIENATSRGTLAGNLMGKAFSSAFDLAEKAVGGLVSQLGKAEESYQSAIKTSQVYVNQFGGNLQQGQNAVYKMQAELAKQAAVLPGSAEDYASVANAIMDNVFQTSTNAEEAMKIVSDISVKIGSRFTASAGVTDSQRIRLSERLMTDNLSIKSMERLMPVMQDASLRSAMRKAEIAFGTSFADAVGKKRQMMVLSALDYVQSDSVIAAASQTMGSSLEQIKDRLFGMYNGLFGVRRDLDASKEGEQSLYTKIGEFLGTFINFANTVGKITEKLGLGSDPMAILGKGLDGLTKFLGEVEKALKPFAENDFKFSPEILGFELSKNLDKMAGGLADFINSIFEAGNKSLEKMDAGKIGGAIGSAIGTFFGKLDYGKIFVSSILSWGKISEMASSAILAALEKFATNLASGVIDSIGKLFRAIDDKFGNIFSKIGSALGIGGGGAGSGPIVQGPTGAFGTVKIDTQKEPALPFGGGLFGGAPAVAPAPKISVPEPKISAPQAGGGLFSPTINLQSNATNNREVANMVIGELGRQYSNYKLGIA